MTWFLHMLAGMLSAADELEESRNQQRSAIEF